MANAAIKKFKSNHQKNTEKISESYVLHFRQTDFPFIFTDIVFRPKNYGQFDYVILQEKTSVAGYLSLEGVCQMHDFGKKLLDKKIANGIIYKLESLLSELEQNSALNQLKALPEIELASRWTILESICDKIGSLYLYCEQPIVAALEESVIEACPNDEDIVKVFHNPKYVKKLKFNSTQKEYLDRLIRLGELKFKIHNLFDLVIEELYSFAKLLAKKFNVSSEKILLLTNNEIVRLVSESELPNEKVTDIRMSGMILMPKRDPKLLTGDDYHFWKNKLEPKNIYKIKGNIAYPGKTRGIVKKHLSLVGSDEIPAGSVIVSGMTNPQIVPFLKNAVAIVTDEGGLTCHAAIVSRELKIPCIVGTKAATQIFNDGDLVEVDANKGIVKLIRKHNE